MKFGAVLWTHSTTWPSLRDTALAVERAGYDSLWIDDHLATVRGEWHDPKLEGWTVLSALAPLTERVTLGLLVSPMSFRHPAVIAKMAVTLDHVSGGRAILGLGAGYFEREHEAYGLEFLSSPGERVARLEEGIDLARRLLDGESFDHSGRFYGLKEALVAPRPVQERLPIMVGGMGKPKTLGIAARYADIWNGYNTFDLLVEANRFLTDKCLEIGRDPGAIERTFIRFAIVRDDAAEAQRVNDRIFERHRRYYDMKPEEVDLCGTPAEVAEVLRRYADAGFEHVIWGFEEPFDLDTIERVGDVRRELASLG
jgi:alkanesulfonate monooxygenase SsuD/methylene tetrahydromethanopterin reductase-like flavin-dependent oxidoreductase (luciferase family)